ncbi:chromatin-remodeling ATPase INO80-like [Prosopis cineraria]|uniref:chromatin-remodeling ATPase INO80-like n=1 Tax=Prosopis cineraria TaxID=364024 RepID=UPI00240EDF61|nr:chromatin-remodeling ATPase INO80-like [Prosopis cineraria]
MDHRRQSKDSLSYSSLFNLESLMNFQLPQQDDDFDYYGNSSQDESRDSQGGAIANYSNGSTRGREVNLLKKRKWSQNSDGEDKGIFVEHT